MPMVFLLKTFTLVSESVNLNSEDRYCNNIENLHFRLLRYEFMVDDTSTT